MFVFGRPFFGITLGTDPPPPGHDEEDEPPHEESSDEAPPPGFRFYRAPPKREQSGP